MLAPVLQALESEMQSVCLWCSGERSLEMVASHRSLIVSHVSSSDDYRLTLHWDILFHPLRNNFRHSFKLNVSDSGTEISVLAEKILM